MRNKILFTGANGFLGKNLVTKLQKSNFLVKTLDLTGADYTFNISSENFKIEESFDIVFHAAGKAHSVPKTDDDAKLFYDVNYKGTKNLCESLESHLPKVFILVSTVAVYGLEEGTNIDENYPLLGVSPYAKSKILAEEYLKIWCKNHQVKLFVLRPSLIAGPNPPGNLKDMINAIKKGYYLNIDGGVGRKSILWVDDFIDIINLSLKHDGGIYNVCATHNPSFKEISNKIAELLNKRNPLDVPYFAAKAFASVGDVLGKISPINSARLNKMMNSLTFSNEKIRRELEWEPSDVMSKFKI